MTRQNPRTPPCAELSPGLNRLPDALSHIHLMGICGTGMSSLAGILKQKGYLVTGSDQNVYPPMSLFLEGLSISIMEGYRPENLTPPPDLVIVGNVITKLNPEAIELSERNIPYLSFPQALKQFAMEGTQSIVVCGTHGKTTTSALAAWILEKAGLRPSFMIGGLTQNFSMNFKLDSGPYFVIEGDEYDTAFFDKGPKFVHYNPRMTILTSIEFDHGDIYRDLDHILESFRRLIRLMPPHGLLIANGDDPLVLAEAGKASCPVVTYGLSPDAQWRGEERGYEGDDTLVDVFKGGRHYHTFKTPLYGAHNLSNLLSTVVLADRLDITKEALSKAMKTFKGVKRRQEIRGEKAGVLIIEDFAHHPTAVKETIGAVKKRYSHRRLLAVFEPRSNSSRRKIFQNRYATAFDGADLIFIPEPPMMEKIPPDERFSSQQLVNDLREKGLWATYAPHTEQLLHDVLAHCLEGDLVLIMSNGAFDHLPDRLLDRLTSREEIRVKTD